MSVDNFSNADVTLGDKVFVYSLFRFSATFIEEMPKYEAVILAKLSAEVSMVCIYN